MTSQTNFFTNSLRANCSNQKELAKYIAAMDDATFEKLKYALLWSVKSESQVTDLFQEL